MKASLWVVLVIAILSTPGPEAAGQTAAPPETVTVQSGALTLRALLWRPQGSGPFPAVMFNHGSYLTNDALDPADPAIIGQVFARHGYIFLFLFREGVGLSADQGVMDGDLMARAFEKDGQAGRNREQLQLLQVEELNQALAGLSFLRTVSHVDARRIALAGHSFGGSLSLLIAERDAALRAVVLFGAAAASWEPSPGLRERLLAAVSRTTAPVLFLHAANDYSIAPGEALAAEMRGLKKPHELKIYPAVGKSPREGHNFLYQSVGTWESDVFAFLDQHLRH